MTAPKHHDLLIGNSFPLALIRRPVQIKPVSLRTLKNVTSFGTIHSFWGHSNTLVAAEQWCGINLQPETERPALDLNRDNLPTLNSITFREVWILSPNYQAGFRPAVGQEIAPHQIIDWQILKMTWEKL